MEPDGQGTAPEEAGTLSQPDAQAGDATSPLADAGPCPGKGATMVPVVTTIGTTYCIDSTEVTQAQYSAFLFDTRGVVKDPPSKCTSKADLTPATGGGCLGKYEPAGKGAYPVVCVDWCDAWSYCHWAGKRLCGPIAGEESKGRAGEWVGACSSNGSRVYPYGDVYVSGTCNDSNATGTTRPAGSMPGCVGGSRGLFDMSGNVNEWIDKCEADDACEARGGNYLSTESASQPIYAHLRCVSADVFHPPRAHRGEQVGFR